MINLNVNSILEASVWVVSFILLLLFVPKEKKRDACISFLFMQLVGWVIGLSVVDMGWIEYPSRFFPKSLDSSFTYEFMAFPTMSVLYNLHFPARRNRVLKICYILAYPSIMTGVEMLFERYTDLIKYTGWQWYWTWLSLAIVLNASFWFYLWFMRMKSIKLI